MKKKPRDPLEPEVYLPSKSDPDYRKHEREYGVDRHVQRLIKKGSVRNRSVLGLDDPKYLAPIYLRQIEQGWKRIPQVGPSYLADKDTYIIEAIRLFSENPIELSTSLKPFPFHYSEDVMRLGGAICQVLGYLKEQALSGDFKTRQESVKRLKKIVKAFLPDTRGKKKVTIKPLKLKLFYWDALFRLYHIRNALRTYSGGRSGRVRTASANFEMPVGLIRELFGLNDEDRPYRQAVTLKDMARELTARHFKITHQTIQNILAS